MSFADDEQLVKNYALFIAVRENRALEEKLQSVRECLERGADVNAADRNDGFSSALHVVARRGDAALARLLLRRGADVSHRNWRGDTPLDTARALHHDCHEIVQVLLTAGKTITEINDAPSTSKQVQSYSTSLDKTMDESQIFRFIKRAGTSGIRGQLYETKLLTLIKMRAEDDNEIEQLHLGSNLRDVGAMDDICLRYRVRGRQTPIALFVQAKHREDCDKNRVTVEDVTSASGDLSLRKYFNSFLAVREQFRADNKDPLFEGDFEQIECNFVIYTPAKENFSKKKSDGKVSEKVDYLINTGGKSFQYDYDENYINITVKMIVQDQCKSLATAFLDLIMPDKNNSEMNKLITKYHVILSRQVLRYCNNQQQYHEGWWEFRSDFFKSDCKFLISFKKTIIKEISTKHYDTSKITNEDLNNFKIILQEPQNIPIISKLIGKLITYNNVSKNFNIIIDTTAIENEITSNKFKTLLEQFHDTNITERDISEAVQMKLKSMKVKLPSAFGNIDMTFNGSKNKIRNRIKYLSNEIVKLFHNNEEHKIVKIEDNIVRNGLINVSGGIGSAVGNLLIFDLDTNMLKLDIDNADLPNNAALLLHELKHGRNEFTDKQLASYRFNIDINNFPKYSFADVENNIKNQLKTFISKLWFYTNQAKEDQVENILTSYINLKEFGENTKSEFQSTLQTSTVFLRAHDKILKWWIESDQSYYLNEAMNFFQTAKLADIDNFIVCGINYMHSFKIYNIDWTFNRRSLPDRSNQLSSPRMYRLFQLLTNRLCSILGVQVTNNQPNKSFDFEEVKFTFEICPLVNQIALKISAKELTNDGYRAAAIVTSKRIELVQCYDRDTSYGDLVKSDIIENGTASFSHLPSRIGHNDIIPEREPWTDPYNNPPLAYYTTPDDWGHFYSNDTDSFFI